MLVEEMATVVVVGTVMVVVVAAAVETVTVVAEVDLAVVVGTVTVAVIATVGVIVWDSVAVMAVKVVYTSKYCSRKNDSCIAILICNNIQHPSR